MCRGGMMMRTVLRLAIVTALVFACCSLGGNTFAGCPEDCSPDCTCGCKAASATNPANQDPWSADIATSETVTRSRTKPPVTDSPLPPATVTQSILTQSTITQSPVVKTATVQVDQPGVFLQ